MWHTRSRIGFAALLVIGVAAPFLVYPTFLMKLLCLALFASAFNLLLGFGGLLSFGHAAFFGASAYVCAHLCRNAGLSPELGVLAGTLTAAGLGAVFGSLAIRRAGIYFAMITLALAQLVYFLAMQMPFTGGENGLQGVPRGRLFGVVDLKDNLAMYFFVYALFLAGFGLIHRTIHSPFGQVLKAIRENEPRAISLGYDVDRYKLIVFVLSAAISGTAGAMKALVFQLASLTDVHWHLSGEVVLMTLLGGLGTVLGPFVGTLTVVVLEDWLAETVGEWSTVIVGAVFVACVLLFRRGLVGEFNAWLRRSRSRSSAATRATGALIALAAGVIVLPMATPTQAQGVTPSTITLGTTAPFSGTLREWGDEYKRGADAYIQHINALGGVHGRKLRIEYLDDAYDAQRTVANARKLVEEQGVFALVNLVGTTNTEALLPHLERMRVPVIGTASGSHTVRAPVVRSRYLFHTRAGYAEETEKIVQHLTSAGVSNIAVVYQNNNLGRAGLASTQAALQRRGLKAVAVTSVETDASNVPAAVAEIRKANPAVIIMITAGAVSTRFINAHMKSGDSAQYFGLNIIGSKQLVDELGDRVRGVMVSQVVPHPWSGTTEIAREYQRLMGNAGHKNLSFVSMEGFINAKLAVLALQRCGPEPTREKFIAALEGTREIDLGGLHLRYTPEDHNGAGKVDLTIIGRNGHFLR